MPTGLISHQVSAKVLSSTSCQPSWQTVFAHLSDVSVSRFLEVQFPPRLQMLAWSPAVIQMLVGTSALWQSVSWVLLNKWYVLLVSGNEVCPANETKFYPLAGKSTSRGESRSYPMTRKSPQDSGRHDNIEGGCRGKGHKWWVWAAVSGKERKKINLRGIWEEHSTGHGDRFVRDRVGWWERSGDTSQISEVRAANRMAKWWDQLWSCWGISQRTGPLVCGSGAQ